MAKNVTPSNFLDLTGKRFGMLTVAKRAENINGRVAWLCKCDCGNEKVVKSIYLTTGDTRSCGCLYEKDLTGQKFGRLTVIKKTSKRENGEIVYKCICDCGNEALVKRSYLTTGGTKSCGCLASEMHSELAKKAFTTNGYSCNKKYSRLYRTWNAMIDRCHNNKCHNYKNYGGRGIKICDEWLNNFKTFYDWAIKNGYQKNLTIERIDVNGNYEPSNCCWITKGEQGYNKTNTVYITIDGVKRSLREWSIISGLSKSLIYNRLKRGYTGNELFCEKGKNHKFNKEETK